MFEIVLKRPVQWKNNPDNEFYEVQLYFHKFVPPVKKEIGAEGLGEECFSHFVQGQTAKWFLISYWV